MRITIDVIRNRFAAAALISLIYLVCSKSLLIWSYCSLVISPRANLPPQRLKSGIIVVVVSSAIPPTPAPPAGEEEEENAKKSRGTKNHHPKKKKYGWFPADGGPSKWSANIASDAIAAAATTATIAKMTQPVLYPS